MNVILKNIYDFFFPKNTALTYNATKKNTSLSIPKQPEQPEESTKSKKINIDYYDTKQLIVNGIYNNISAWQGLRYLGNEVYLICGTSGPTPQTGNGVIYIGNINCIDGQTYILNVPNPENPTITFDTSIYGPNYDSNSGLYTFVGSYVTKDSITDDTSTHGFIYRGGLKPKDLINPCNFYYTNGTLANDYDITFFHSFSGNFLVGNSLNSITHKSVSYLYEFLPIITNGEPVYIKFPGSITTTSYGIWCYKKNEYTIVGGYYDEIHEEHGFIVDYNSITNTFTNWTTVSYPDRNFPTHLQGIGTIRNDIYCVNANVIEAKTNIITGYYVTIERDRTTSRFIVNNDWIKLDYDMNSENKKKPRFTSSNSIANNCMVGLVVDGNDSQSFQAKISMI